MKKVAEHHHLQDQDQQRLHELVEELGITREDKSGLHRQPIQTIRLT